MGICNYLKKIEFKISFKRYMSLRKLGDIYLISIKQPGKRYYKIIYSEKGSQGGESWL